jgi:hypothetical protein
MRVSVAIFALAACAPQMKSMYAPNPDIDGPVIDRGPFGHVEGFVLDRVTGLPVAYADILIDQDRVGWSDQNGHYEMSVHLGRTTATVIGTFEASWMDAEPFDVAPGTTTRNLLVAEHHCTSIAADADEVFKLVLTTRFGDLRRGHLPIVDDRKASAGNSVSIAGIDLTTRGALQDEADRSHKSIAYVHIDAELVTPCSVVVTVGERSVIPNEEGISLDEGVRELYGKTAAGWRKVGALIGYAE